MKKSIKYESLNGIRTFACIGILMMHVLTNGSYNLNHIFMKVIGSFTQLVYLFMIISSFSMCCGYYEKIKYNKISLEEFYNKRIKKTMPFFIFLIIIDVIYCHNFDSFIEGFANVTMMFNFIPNELNVIGVGWFLGLVFVFYMIFPFFVYLFSNKKRACFVTLISFVMSYFSVSYFDLTRVNMFYSFVYFCVGGFIYLFRDNIVAIVNKNRFITIFLLLFLTSLYYFKIYDAKYVSLFLVFLFGLLTCYIISIKSKILNNSLVTYFSNISFEIYLSHMLLFRVIEKLKLVNIFDNQYLSYISTCCICIISTVFFIKLYDLFFKYVSFKIKGVEKYG